MTMTLAEINAPGAPQTTGNYSQALEISQHERLLFISGQIPVAADGTVPETFEAQCELAWDNVRHQLNAAGMDIDNLVKVTIFLSSRRFNATNRKVRLNVLGDHKPALTVIITGIFDEQWLLEIEAIAAA